MAKPKEQEFSNAITSDLSEKLFNHHLQTEVMRQKIISIFNEEIKKVDFAKTIKEYASEEMDRRVFTSAKYWSIVVVSAALTALLSTAITLGVSNLIQSKQTPQIIDNPIITKSSQP